ncbi:MAG TPA: GNAT family N-acetyltransferase [Microbacteriaceae bacterium]|nr:GNAT family N-acetyltransferase [Microbacteriaceae bacterium]
MSATVANNPAESRYEVVVDGEVGGFLSYALSDGVIDLQHTVVQPSHRGQGLAGLLAERAFEDARAQGLGVIPSCPFIAGWVPDHPEVADLIVTPPPA